MKYRTHLFTIGSIITLFHLNNSIKAQNVVQVSDSISTDSLKKNKLVPTGIAESQKEGNNSIKGSIIDSTSQKPADYITVNLKTATGESLKSTLSKSDGSFIFDKISAGKYTLAIIAVGYSKKVIHLTVDSTKQVWDIGAIALSKESKQLGEVLITAERPLIKHEVDRIAYDVQADPESKVDNVLDMMRKVPLISIDGDDKIKFKGSDNYKILIDGRPSSLIAKNPEDVFKSMPAINILKIEVITTPPSKYDSEGLAGIINIITNKKIGGGYNGTIGARYNLLFGPGTSASLTAKHKRIGFSFNGGMNRRRARPSSFSNQRTSNTPESQLEQSGTRAFRGSFGYLSAELSYEIDTLNLITTSVGYNANAGGQAFETLNQQYDLGQLTQSYWLDNTADYTWGGYDLGINYQKGFKRDKEQLLTTSYKINSYYEQALIENLITENNYDGNRDFHQQNKVGTIEQTVQMDYVHPVKKITIEGGVKAILRASFSDYGRQNFIPVSGDFITDPERSDEFDYQQNVFSFYNSYQLKLDKWSVKAGLRLERTVIDADFTSSFEKLNTDYNNFIPSVSIQRKFKKMSSVNLGYTQRIQRPGIWQLNPSADINDKFVQSGNTGLTPVLNHNFDLSYTVSKKGSITSGLSYSFANNTIQHVSHLDGDTTRTTFQNIGKNKNLGANLSTNYPFTKNFSVNVNARISYLWIDGRVNGELYENEGPQGNANVNTSYKLDNDWKAGLNAGYYSPWLTLQGKSNPYYYTSVSLSKEFLKKKASLSASVNNPFQKMWSWKNKTTSPEFIQTSNYSNFYRQVNLSFNYKFGKLKDGIKKNKRGISNDDVSGGKSGAGE